MRLLQTSLLSIMISYAPMALSSDATYQEEKPLRLTQTSPSNTYEPFVQDALNHYHENNLLDAVNAWIKALKNGYDISSDTPQRALPYVFTLQNLRLHSAACDFWENYLADPHKDIAYSWHKRYAISAMSDCRYNLALSNIKKYMDLGGTLDSEVLLLCAQSHSMLDQHQEASYYWHEYFFQEKQERIPYVAYINASIDFRSKGAFKEACKYLTLGLSKAAENNVVLAPENHATYACTYMVGRDFEKATQMWAIYLDIPNIQPTTAELLDAGKSYFSCRNYEKARDLFERLLDKSTNRTRALDCVFALGKIHGALGNMELSIKYFDEALNATNKEQFSLHKMTSQWFYEATVIYTIAGAPEKANAMIKLHNTIKPRSEQLSNPFFSLQQTKGKSSKGRKAPTHERSIQDLYHHIKVREQERCNELIKKIQSLDFSSFNEESSQEVTRHNLLGDLENLFTLLQKLEHKDAGIVSAQGTQTPTILTIQEQINVLERDYDTLKHAHDVALKAHNKSRVRAFLATLEIGNDISAITSIHPTNLRNLYGHEKQVKSSPTQTTTMTTTTTDIPQEAPPLPQVSFFQLRSIEKDLLILKRIPGMAAKYDAFLSEIKQNPTGLLFSSGKAKTLVGEKGIYSRRFDKANRLVYRVTKQNDGSFHVAILSVLGHYNDLEAKMEKSRQEKNPQKKTNKTKKKNNKEKSKNNKK